MAATPRCKSRENLARRNPVFWDLVIQREGAEILLARANAAGVGAFNPDGAGRGKRRADVVCDGAIALMATQGAQQEVVVTEKGQEPFINDRDVREL